MAQSGAEEWNRRFEIEHEEENSIIRRFRVERMIGEGSVHARGGERKNPNTLMAESSSTGSYNSVLRSGHLRVLGFDPDDLGIDHPTDRDPFKVWPYPERVMEIVRQIEFWYQSKEWFQSRGIPWRTGINIHGIPGTGKTTLLKAIAQRLDLPVFLFDLGSMDNNEFARYWQEALNATPCMPVFEEVDTVFHGRENIRGQEGGGLSFDHVLSTVSGMGNSDGVCLGITTNHLEHLDPALGAPDENGRSKRPGRVEHIVELGAMEERERRAVARQILGDTAIDIERVVRETEGEVADNVVHHCARLAYQTFWDDRRMSDQEWADYQEAEYQWRSYHNPGEGMIETANTKGSL